MSMETSLATHWCKKCRLPIYQRADGVWTDKKDPVCFRALNYDHQPDLEPITPEETK